MTDWSEPQGDGDCFEVALMNAYDDERLTVCHGRPINQGDLIPGQRFWHAWNETADGLVIDQSNGNDIRMPHFLYYAIGKIEPTEVRRYSMREAAELAIEHEHYGPWT